MHCKSWQRQQADAHQAVHTEPADALRNASTGSARTEMEWSRMDLQEQQSPGLAALLKPNHLLHQPPKTKGPDRAFCFFVLM